MTTAILAGVTRRGRMGNPINPPTHSPLKVQNRLLLDILSPGKDGKPYVSAHIENTGNNLTTQGLDQLVTLLWSGTGTISTAFFQYAGMGTSTVAPTASQTGLQSSIANASCALGGGSFVMSRTGAQVVQAQITITGGATSVGEVGLFWGNAVTASMICRQTFTQTNKGASDTIQCTYQLSFTT